MLSVLRSNRALRRLLAAWAQSCVGTGAGYVALLLLTYRHLHTSWAISVVLLADFAPAIVFGSWFGALADRYPKRPLVVVANLLQAAAYGGLAVSTTAAPIISLALLAGIGNSLQRPALRSALPIIAGDARQLAAALFDGCRWAGTTAGPLVAAALFAFGGPAIPLVVNAVSFLIAAIVIAGVTIGLPSGHAARGPVAATGLREGLAAALDAPGIRLVIACAAGTVVAGGLLNVSEPIFATRTLHGSGSDYALLVACYGVGMVAATVLVAQRGERSAAVLTRRFLGAVALVAAGLTGSAIAGSVSAAALAFVGTGYGNALALVSATQLIQHAVAPSVQGRLFGAKDAVEGFCFLVGLLGAGALISLAGVRVTLATAAAICAVCVLAGIGLLRRRTGERAWRHPLGLPVSGAGPRPVAAGLPSAAPPAAQPEVEESGRIA